VRRRLIAEREKKIDRELEEIRKSQAIRREARSEVPIVALIGYTNAGKSLLMNRISGSELESRNQVFTSLDLTMRR
jgi:GTP-binding protein HflX